MSLLLEAINDRGNPPPITCSPGDILQIVRISAKKLEDVRDTPSIVCERDRVRQVVRTTIKALAHWARLSDLDAAKRERGDG